MVAAACSLATTFVEPFGTSIVILFEYVDSRYSGLLLFVECVLSRQLRARHTRDLKAGSLWDPNSLRVAGNTSKSKPKGVSPRRFAQLSSPTMLAIHCPISSHNSQLCSFS